MIGGGYFQFLEISDFFIHRKLRPMNEKALRAGCALRIPNRQNLLPPLYHAAFSVQKMPACEQ